jgi:hypothetical protein
MVGGRWWVVMVGGGWWVVVGGGWWVVMVGGGDGDGRKGWEEEITGISEM